MESHNELPIVSFQFHLVYECVRFDGKVYPKYKSMRVQEVMPSTKTDCHLLGNTCNYMKGSYLLNGSYETLNPSVSLQCDRFSQVSVIVANQISGAFRV